MSTVAGCDVTVPRCCIENTCEGFDDQHILAYVVPWAEGSSLDQIRVEFHSKCRERPGW